MKSWLISSPNYSCILIPVGERYLLWKKGTKAGLALIYLLLSNLLIWKNRLEQLLNRHKLRVTREATQKQGVRHIFNTSVHTEAVVVALPCLLLLLPCTISSPHLPKPMLSLEHHWLGANCFTKPKIPKEQGAALWRGLTKQHHHCRSRNSRKLLLRPQHLSPWLDALTSWFLSKACSGCTLHGVFPRGCSSCSASPSL